MKNFEFLLFLPLCLLLLFPARASAGNGRHIVVLDTDIGADDALAFMVAALSQNVRIDCFVASSGNGTLDNVYRNALIMRKYWGLSGTVVRSGPCEGISAADVSTFHGSDGLGEISGKLGRLLGVDPEKAENTLSYDAFKAVLREADTVTYISIGPLTTLSDLIDDDRIRSRIGRVLLMGGGIQRFNHAHDTEFNFSADPESAKKILEAGLDVTLFPLDLTYTQTVDPGQIGALAATGNYAAYISLLQYNRDANMRFNRLNAAVPHDTMPVLFLAHPEAFRVEDMTLTVDEYGGTRVNGSGAPVHVALSAEDGLLTGFLTDAFEKGRKDGFSEK